MRKIFCRYLQTVCFCPPTPQKNLTYSLHKAGGGNDWWNRFDRFQSGMEAQSYNSTRNSLRVYDVSLSQCSNKAYTSNMAAVYVIDGMTSLSPICTVA